MEVELYSDGISEALDQLLYMYSVCKEEPPNITFFFS